MQDVTDPNPDLELGERGDGYDDADSAEPLLVTFCKLPTSDLERRLEDQWLAAELLRECAHTETRRIDVRVRVQCLRSALGRLKDHNLDEKVKSRRTLLESEVDVAQIQLDLTDQAYVSRACCAVV